MDTLRTDAEALMRNVGFNLTSSRISHGPTAPKGICRQGLKRHNRSLLLTNDGMGIKISSHDCIWEDGLRLCQHI